MKPFEQAAHGYCPWNGATGLGLPLVDSTGVRALS
jgi:hypothetical protein